MALRSIRLKKKIEVIPNAVDIDKFSDKKTELPHMLPDENEWEKITMLLMPLAPHLAHECCEKINKKFYWPKHDPKLLKGESCTIVIQVDGRKRGILEMPTNLKEIMVIKKSKEIDELWEKYKLYKYL